MSTIIYHNHHIIPKYRCKEIGIDPDFEGNIIRLARLEHAEAHWHRWFKHKDPRDLGAAQFLARGEIDGLDMSGEKNPMYGKKHSPETLKKMSVAHMGKKHSPETLEKMSAAKSGEKHYNYGKKLSAETRKKLSEAAKNRKSKEKTLNKPLTFISK